MEKSNSLQPATNNNESNFNGFSNAVNKNLSKSYATEINAESVTKNIREKPQFYDNPYGYTSIEEESEKKKKKIYWVNDFHREKIAENSRYRKQELSKLREQINDQEEVNNKIIESSRL